MEAARSFLYTKNVPKGLWAETVNCAVYTLNRVLSSTQKKTPYEIWFGKKPDVSHLRIFGSRVYIHVPAVNRQKLDPKGVECIFIGYCDTSKAYRVFDPSTQKVMISRDVIFDELQEMTMVKLTTNQRPTQSEESSMKDLR